MSETTWFRVEVSDQHGQIVAIETEMLAGRDIGDEERDVINRAIDHLAGFVGRQAIAAPDVRAAALEEAARICENVREELRQMGSMAAHYGAIDCAAAIRAASGNKSEPEQRRPEKPE